MQSVTIKKVLSSRQPDGKPYTITQFLGTDEEVYKTFSKDIKEGETYEGRIEEKDGERVFRKGDGGGGFSKGGERQFKADPESRESIEWQTSLKAAVEVVRDYHTLRLGTDTNKVLLEDYAKEVDKIAVHFKNLITLKPKSIASEPSNDDRPPVEELEPEL